MKNARNTLSTLSFSCLFTLWRQQLLVVERVNKRRVTRVTAGKKQKRAGATPVFGLSAAQKV
ncbi:MAG: hypothetical protein WA664_14710, partial [Candidatus Acidiferrales bacterium]